MIVVVAVSYPRLAQCTFPRSQINHFRLARIGKPRDLDIIPVHTRSISGSSWSFASSCPPGPSSLDLLVLSYLVFCSSLLLPVPGLLVFPSLPYIPLPSPFPPSLSSFTFLSLSSPPPSSFFLYLFHSSTQLLYYSTSPPINIPIHTQQRTSLRRRAYSSILHTTCTKPLLLHTAYCN